MPGKSKTKAGAKVGTKAGAKVGTKAGTKAKAAAKPKTAAKAKAGAKGPRPQARPATPAARPAARLIEQRIRDLGDWRGETLAQMRALILEAEPEMTEEVKWIKPSNPWGVPLWSRAGMVCTGEPYAKVVKFTFARGASLPDPKGLFNASLDAGTRRAIDVREGAPVDAAAFKALVRAAVAFNEGRA